MVTLLLRDKLLWKRGTKIVQNSLKVKRKKFLWSNLEQKSHFKCKLNKRKWGREREEEGLGDGEREREKSVCVCVCVREREIGLLHLQKSQRNLKDHGQSLRVKKEVIICTIGTILQFGTLCHSQLQTFLYKEILGLKCLQEKKEMIAKSVFLWSQTKVLQKANVLPSAEGCSIINTCVICLTSQRKMSITW